ncbi:hypothetical protein BKA69DRAFT_1042655 [Paraphysoderma sedebokerense]|nr:hypothetical protein BKA69DRAFT_1042655 [Paraphysoderma sedebokerense]
MSSAQSHRQKPSQYINNSNLARHLSPSRRKPSKADAKLIAPLSPGELSRTQFFMQSDSARGRSTRKRHCHTNGTYPEHQQASSSSAPQSSHPGTISSDPQTQPRNPKKSRNMNGKQQQQPNAKKDLSGSPRNHQQESNASLSDSAVGKNNPSHHNKQKKNHSSKHAKNQDNFANGLPIDGRTAQAQLQNQGKRKQFNDKNQRQNSSSSPPVSKMSKSFDELKNFLHQRSHSSQNAQGFPPVSFQTNQSTRRASFGADASISATSTLYAGPTFHNSPAPSSLPIPVFGMGTPTKSMSVSTPDASYDDESGVFSMEDITRNEMPHSKSYPSLSSFQSQMAANSDQSDKDDEDEDNETLRIRSRQLLNLLSSAATAASSSSPADSLSPQNPNHNTSSASKPADMYSQYLNQPANRIPNPYAYPSYSSFPTPSPLSSASHLHANTHIHMHPHPPHAHTHTQNGISGLENELRSILRIDAKSS